MLGGYNRTVRLLAKSNNRAAADLLNAALKSSHVGVRRAACIEVLSSRSSKALLDFIRKFDQLDDETLAVLKENPEKLTSTLRAALLSKDHVLQKNALRATLYLKAYELIPELLGIIVEQRQEGNKKTDVPLDELLLRLTRFFLQEIEENGSISQYQSFILDETGKIIKRAIIAFRRTDNPIVLKVYLYLGRYIRDDESRIVSIFHDPLHPAYAAIANLLQKDTDPIIFKFIFDSLEVDNVPGFILATLSCRLDVAFWESILEKMPSPPSEYAKANFKRLHRFDWSGMVRPFIAQLDEKCQVSLVDIVRFSSLPQDEQFSILSQFIDSGKSLARSAAVSALSAFSNVEADEIIWNATEDADPNVQAAALTQLRYRNFSNGTVQLLKFADSPHQVVRDAVRNVLPEFRMSRFLETYAKLSDEQRAASLKIIRKLDDKAPQVLANELLSKDTAKRTKALVCIELGKFLPQLEEQVCALLLRDESPAIRIKAAQLLANGKREISRNSLLKAYHNDTSFEVRITAKTSLENREQ
ncbi:MAG: HEAT repeat domain-containing protein [Thermoguttaceae bacterium]